MYERYLQLLEENNSKSAVVAKETGIHPSTFTDWKKGKSHPKREKIEKIADFFGVNPDWITGTSQYKTKDEMYKQWSQMYDEELIADEARKHDLGCRIPVVGNVAAGIPIEAIEEVLDWEEIPLVMARTGTFFGLKIKGDSMAPRISEGDVVIVRRQEVAESGDIVIVKVNGESATCKRLVTYAEGISLISFNPAFEPMTWTTQEIEDKPIKIIGKVVENRQKY